MFTQEELDEKFKGGEVKVVMRGGRVYEGIISRCLFHKRDDGASRLSINIEYMVTYIRGRMVPCSRYPDHPLKLEYNFIEELASGGIAFTCPELGGETVVLRPQCRVPFLDHDAIRRLHAAAAAA